MKFIYYILAAAAMAAPASGFAQNRCMSSPEEAATSFVTWSIRDAHRTIELVQPRNLKQFRARLEQIVDDRYAPDSALFREKFLGVGWSKDRIKTASDREFVGHFLASGEQRRRDWQIEDIRAEESKKGRFSGQDVIVSYRVKTPEGSTLQRREFSAYLDSGCWVLQVPLETWARLDQIAKIMKQSRVENLPNRQGPSRSRLQIAPASESASPEMRQLPQRVGSLSVWVDSTPLLTEEHVTGAHASWDCDGGGREPEDPSVWLTFSEDGANVLRRWTAANSGAMLAVVVDGTVVVFARVAGVLGTKLSVCLPNARLEEARAMAAELMGAPK